MRATTLGAAIFAICPATIDNETSVPVKLGAMLNKLVIEPGVTAAAPIAAKFQTFLTRITKWQCLMNYKCV